MKKLLALALIGGSFVACTAKDASTVEKDVFTSVEVACVLEHATLDNASIATACGIAQTLIPSLETILAAHRQGIGVPKAAGCPHAVLDLAPREHHAGDLTYVVYEDALGTIPVAR